MSLQQQTFKVQIQFREEGGARPPWTPSLDTPLPLALVFI